MAKITVSDIDIRYMSKGDGHPLFLVRGFTASLEEWNPALIDSLSKRYRVITFDNRGAGETTAPPGPFSMRLLADDTAGLIRALGFDSCYLLGESMGGMIAQELAIVHPDLVDKLVLCCTFCGGEESAFPSREVIEVMADRSGTPREVARRNIPILFPDSWIEDNPSEVDSFIRRGLRFPMDEVNVERQLEAIMGFSSYRRLPDIRCPTLVTCGTDDVIIPPRNSRLLADRIPDSTLIEFEGGGHAFMDQVIDEFIDAVCVFLSG